MANGEARVDPVDPGTVLTPSNVDQIALTYARLNALSVLFPMNPSLYNLFKN